MDQFRTTWGLVGPGAPWNDLCSFIGDAAADGYAGVEFPLAHLAFQADALDTAIAEVVAALAQYGLKVLPLIATRPDAWASAAEHLHDFRRQADIAARLGATKAPVHAGADSFDHATARRFVGECISVADDLGIDACFETHRGRPLNDPWRAARLLEALPDLRLTSDLSHWHVVVDRDPADILDLFDEASRRSGHLHARIGHEKGPQVPHPADPLWQSQVALYRRWWTITRDSAQARGEPFTVTPEFGPPPYMTTRPFTHEWDADLVALNKWMHDRLEDWFG